MLPGVEKKVNYYVKKGDLLVHNWMNALEGGGI
jgi:hypothetical protein